MNNIPTRTIPSLQGTFAKRPMPTLQPNFAKEPFTPSHSNGKISDPQKTKDGASIGGKYLILNKTQHTINRTMSGLQDPAISPC
jgi:hypothetical protein